MKEVIEQKLEKERLKDLALARAQKQPAPWEPRIQDRAPWRSPLQPWCDQDYLSTGDLLFQYEEEITWLRKAVDDLNFQIDRLELRTSDPSLEDELGEAQSRCARLLLERDVAAGDRDKAENERDEALAKLNEALEKLKDYEKLGQTAKDDDLTITVRVVDMD
jgi:hypothetical protein